MRYPDSGLVQCREGAIFVPQRGIDHGQPERVVVHSDQSFDFGALANHDIRASNPRLDARPRSFRIHYT